MKEVAQKVVIPAVAFCRELARRRVVRFGVTYLVGAWVLVEVSAVVLPAIGLPESSVTAVIILVGLGLPVALLLSWIFDFTPEGIVRTEAHSLTSAANAPERAAADRAQAEDRSIAVLAFSDRSPDKDQEYLADGVAEELINILGRSEGLRIAARSSAFSFKGYHGDIREIGRQLNVAYVLDGSVRKSRDGLRISAELIDVESGYCRWMNSYDRPADEVFNIQDDISRCIVQELTPELLGPEANRTLVYPGTGNLEAYNCYLKGRFYWNSRYAVGLERGIEYFKKAAELDPGFALPWSGLADSYSLLAFYNFVAPMEGFQQAREAAERSFELNPRLAETNASVAFVCAFFDWDFQRAETRYRRALDENPAYGPARFWYAFLLAALGRLDEATDQIARARAAEPFSAIINGGAAYLDYFLRRHDAGMHGAREVLQADPNFGPAYMFLGFHCVAADRAGEAVQFWRKAVEREDRLVLAHLMLACALACADDRPGADKILAAIEKQSPRYVSSYFRAAIAVALGQRDTALASLERALEERNNFLVLAGMDPLFEELHEEKRFRRILEQVGVPLQYAATAQPSP